MPKDMSLITTDGKSCPYADDLKAGDLLQDEFRIERHIGRGGMGSVYLVHRIADGQLYAMKTLNASMLTLQTRRRLFFRELRTWIDLPEHPNLVTCRFFRMIKDRLVVFSDYIDGGSLEDRIVKKKIQDLATILDIAIQTAWGLEAAHQSGLVHQDIKPANILMSSDGIAKITDFGISKALEVRDIADDPHQNNPESNIMSSEGMTAAYCSPEQGRYERLDYRTDIWSWGVSVLEMFTGGVTWVFGAFADGILKNLLQNGSPPGIPAMPVTLTSILSMCLKQNRSDRWENFGLIAQLCEETYRTVTGIQYPRVKPSITSRFHPLADKISMRATTHGCKWSDPKIWLERVKNLTGLDQEALQTILPKRVVTRKAQHVVDLEILDEADHIYSKLIKDGQEDLIDEYAGLLQEKAWLYENSGDFHSALNLYLRIIPIRQRIAEYEKIPKMKFRLALSWMFQGAAQFFFSRFEESARSFTEAIDLMTGIPDDENIDASTRLAWAYMNRASCYNQLCLFTEALDNYRHAISIFEGLTLKSSKRSHRHDLALVWMNMASLLSSLNKHAQASCLYRKASISFRRLIQEDPKREIKGFLAISSTQLAISQAALCNRIQALKINENAISILKELIDIDGYREYENLLAVALHNHGEILCDLNRMEKAGEKIQQAEELMRGLIIAGRRDLESNLAFVLRSKARIECKSDRIQAALEAINAAIVLTNRLITTDNRIDLIPEKGLMLLKKADLLLASGNRKASLETVSEVLALMKNQTNLQYRQKQAQIIRKARYFLSKMGPSEHQ